MIEKIKTAKVKNKNTSYWSVRGLTTFLIIVAALIPVVSALGMSYWLNGNYNRQEFILELGIASLALSLIAYPIYYLLNWENKKIEQWDESRQDFRLLIDQVVDMVFLLNIDGKIVEANERACELLGYSKDEFKELSILDLDVDSHLYRNPSLIEQIKKGKNITYDSHYLTKRGVKFPVESRAKMVSWLREAHYIEFVSDISHRLEMNKQIDESREVLEKTRNILEQRISEHSVELKRQRQGRKMAEKYAISIQNYLENLIDSMPSAIIAVDRDYRIMQWNVEAERISGVANNIAHGNRLSKLLPVLYQHIEEENNNRDMLNSKFSFNFEMKINDEFRILEVMIYSIDSLHEEEKGEVIRIDDITEKLKIIETLAQSEKMLSLGGLAAGMAHEINNPLGAIVQSTQNIKRRLIGDLERNKSVAKKTGIDLDSLNSYLKQQKIDEFLEGILLSGERAAYIVGDMLNFARPANKGADKVSLTSTLDAAVRLSEKSFNQKKQFDFRKIKIVKNYSDETIQVVAQKSQLEQVFLNLLTNAAQAITQNKNSGRKPHINLTIRKDGDLARIDIADNGPGMSLAVCKRVFEPFFTTKDEKTGTGLGLSVSYFIVCEQLGGKMSVESVLSQGSCFSIHLPLAKSDPKVEVDPDEQIELPL